MCYLTKTLQEEELLLKFQIRRSNQENVFLFYRPYAAFITRFLSNLLWRPLYGHAANSLLNAHPNVCS